MHKTLVFIILFSINICFGYSTEPVKGDTSNLSRNNYLIIQLDSIIDDHINRHFNLDQDILHLQSNIGEVSNTPDIIEYRLKQLDNESPIKFSYNEIVQKYIDLYLTKRSNMVAKMLGSSQLYYPMFEKKLDKYDLPLELKHLAIVESALNPLARSKSGAIGLWQFLYDTAKLFNLEITSYIDERRDPVKSTEAACQYLEYLYNVFGDWELALAAYNGGPSVVRNAIIRSGGKTNYWELRPYLPEQTQGYVPAFVAVNYVMNYYKEHKIVPMQPKYIFYKTDTVIIKGPVSLAAIAAEINIPLTNLKFLNPVYKQYYIPASVIPASITLPASKVSEYLKKESTILKKSNEAQNRPSTKNEKCSKLIHTVKKGEYLHLIAVKYKCSKQEVKDWNNLQSDALSTGEDLTIWIPSSQAYRFKSNLAPKKNVNTYNTDYIYYTFQEEENVEETVKRLSNLNIQEFLEINNYSCTQDIKPGTKLILDYK